MSLFLSVLPLALGAAVSPALLTLVVLILSGKHRPRARAWAMALGCFVVVLGYVAIGLTLLSRLPDHNSGTQSPAMAWGKIVCGVLLGLLGIRELMPARTPGEKATARSEARAQRMAGAGLPMYIGIGVVGMLLNFSSLVLFFPALHDISASNDAVPVEVSVTVFLIAMMMLPVVGPVLLITVMGPRGDPVLAAMNRFSTGHKRQINAGICFLFMALLLYSGIKGLH